MDSTEDNNCDPVSWSDSFKAKIRNRRKSGSKLLSKSAPATSPNTDDEGFVDNCNGNSKTPHLEEFQRQSSEAQEEFVSPVNGDSRDDTGLETELTVGDGAPPALTGRELVPLAPAAIQLTADEKKKLLRKFPYFKLTVVIGSGKDLIAMDRGGVSDPYLKALHGQDKLFATKEVKKSVNPMWAETHTVHIDNPFRPITFQVYDKDMVGSDDFMGETEVDLQELDLKKLENFSLQLSDGNHDDLKARMIKKKKKSLGSINLSVTMDPMTKEEMNEISKHLFKQRRLNGSVHLCASIVKQQEGILSIRHSLSHNDMLDADETEASDGGHEHQSASRKESFLGAANRILRAEKMGGKGKAMLWSAVVHVVMVQARGLTAMDNGESSDPYCKLSMGKEKYKTKSIDGTVNPKWREAFDFNWFEEYDSEIEITIWDKDVGSKDDFMGRVMINLLDLEKEKTHNIWADVEDGDGKLHLLVTISGTTRGDSPSNLTNWEDDLDRMKVEWSESYRFHHATKAMKDVGHLLVKVFKAQGLASADIGGKSDPFCVVELNNDRLMTNTEYKTLSPEWNKVFQFNVKDIHDILEITVFDEDKDHQYEFLGKIMVPLMKIRNSERKWYSLKDKKMRSHAKGDHPRILLEMFFVYNKVRASVRTFNPKQIKYEDKSDVKFKHAVFMRNINRIKAATADFDPDVAIRELKSILSWENKPKTAGVFIGFELGVYFFEPWMITLGLTVPFILNIVILTVTGGWSKSHDDQDKEEDDDEDESPASGEKKKEGEEKTSLKEKMQAMQEITLLVQNALGMVAHILESIGNVFNFSVPFLTWLAFIVIILATVVLYNVSLRYLLMAWGANKFLKKLFKPNAINNNELADFISRVPDNEEIKDRRELPSQEAVAQAKLQAKKKPASDNDVI